MTFISANKSNSFCAQPWVGLQIAPDRAIRPCCMFEKELGYYKHNASLRDSFSGSVMSELRQKVLNGNWHSGCLGCQKEEELTGTSPRIFSPELRGTIESHEKNLTFLKVELFFDNLCNLDCVMCQPIFSSKWNKHVENLNVNNINFKNLKQTKHNKLTRLDIEQLFDNCRSAEHLILIGGEPFASPEAMYFLELWSKASHSATLQITTNGTIIGDSEIDLLEKCPNLILQISIDAVGDLYEWIRGFSWIKVESNLKKLQARGIPFRISPTIGIYNVHHIIDLYTFCEKFNFDIEFGHILREPEFLSALNLNLDIRSQIIDTLPNTLKSGIPIIKSFLKNETLNTGDENLKKSLSWIKYFNKQRGVSLFQLSKTLLNFYENI